MSGIIDSKTRVLDTIVTLEGRKQLSQGGINIKYVTFNDAATFYSADIVSGSSDATARIYFESCHLPQDQVTFSANVDGRISTDTGVFAGQVSLTQTISGSSIESITTLRAAEMQDYFDNTLLPSAIDNFQKQRSIATRDPIFHDDGFALGNNSIEFVIHDEKPIKDRNAFIANLNYLEDIFADPRMSTVSNFKYLPPINRIDDDGINKKDHRNLSRYSLGNYSPWGVTHAYPVNHADVSHEHDQYGKMGYVRTVNFDPTSRENNLFIQAFEVTNDTMHKLEVIDFGTWHTPPPVRGSSTATANSGTTYHTFFIGKLMIKPSTGTHAFVHLFTLIFG